MQQPKPAPVKQPKKKKLEGRGAEQLGDVLEKL